jgi:hypothetical protein
MIWLFQPGFEIWFSRTILPYLKLIKHLSSITWLTLYCIYNSISSININIKSTPSIPNWEEINELCQKFWLIKLTPASSNFLMRLLCFSPLKSTLCQLFLHYPWYLPLPLSSVNILPYRAHRLPHTNQNIII